MKDSLQIIIPTTTKDYIRMRHLVPERVFRYLPASELILIGNEELCSIVNDDIKTRFGGMRIRTLHEEELVQRQPVIDLIMKRADNIGKYPPGTVRPGWYYQQFLKMAFNEMCEGDYYMSWDMDTVPLRHQDFFDESGRPAFDLKSEFNPAYFGTISRLLGLDKNVDGSFVAEHMVFNREYMEELLNSIDNGPADGGNTWEKIIGAVHENQLLLGFSEFETYGTFVTDKHPEAYSYRKFASLRRGSWFLKPEELTQEDEDWLSGSFDAITFENADTIPDMANLFRNQKYRSNMSAKKFYETILESGYFGDYSDGKIHAGDWDAPV